MTQRWNGDVLFTDKWQLFLVCPACKGTQIVPPRPPGGVALSAGMPCEDCDRGMCVRFLTTAELKAFVSALPD